MKYFDLLDQIQKSEKEGDYDKMLELCKQTLCLLPKFVENWKKRYGQFDLKGIPALDNGCLFWPIRNQKEVLYSMQKVVDSVPELKEGWGDKVAAAFETERLSKLIQEYVKEHPGTLQSQLGKILGKQSSDVGFVAYYLDKFGVIKRVKSGRSYSLFINRDIQKVIKPSEGERTHVEHTAPLEEHQQIRKRKDVDVISDFYVYLHKNPKTGIPFYVGKGRGKRVFDTASRDKEWHDFVESIGGKFDVEIVHKNLRETEAYDIEVELIARYGKKRDGTGSLINWTDGGEGPTVTIVADIPWLQKVNEKAYENTLYRVLLNEERDRFVTNLSNVIKSLLDSFEEIYERETDHDLLESKLQSLEYDTFQYSKRRISSQDIAFSIDEEIKSLKYSHEYKDKLNEKLKALMEKCIIELRKIREELMPK